MKTFLTALSVSTGLGTQFGLENGGGSVPVLCLHFPDPLAGALVDQLLKPYATIENTHLILEPVGPAWLLSGLSIIRRPGPVALPIPFKQPPEATTYIIGQSVLATTEQVNEFTTAFRRTGFCYLVVGFPLSDGVTVARTIGRWRLKLERIDDDTLANIVRRVR